MAGVQCLANPGEHLVIQPEPAKQLGELLLQHLLADVAAAARGGFTLALIGVAGAVVIDVALLLDLADHRATALGTGDEP